METSISKFQFKGYRINRSLIELDENSNFENLKISFAVSGLVKRVENLFILNLPKPLVIAVTFPSGNLIILMILAKVPIWYISFSVGFSKVEDFLSLGLSPIAEVEQTMISSINNDIFFMFLFISYLLKLLL